MYAISSPEEGHINSTRFRFEDNEEQHILKVNKVIEQDIKNGFGNTS